MTKEQARTPTAKQIIKAAIAAAGGVQSIAETLGIERGTVYCWAQRGRISVDHIKPLCDLGGGLVKADQILEAMGRERLSA